ncbi:hypothetical protein HaLaN_20888 [Haematococcus lacustris]|uniref:Uncharacterized protein n=1 Tax=Haematococcus lacustris TaxID=44745 RepID=A0A699ZX80_HAELA|nr:hypothetical protein HaLaN_20888 [Haematococcus lacustris]
MRIKASQLTRAVHIGWGSRVGRWCNSCAPECPAFDASQRGKEGEEVYRTRVGGAEGCRVCSCISLCNLTDHRVGGMSRPHPHSGLQVYAGIQVM